MSSTQRQIIWSLWFSFLLALVIGAVLIYVFPLGDWSELWTRDFMNIPIVIFVPVFSIAIGIFLGGLSGLLEETVTFD